MPEVADRVVASVDRGRSPMTTPIPSKVNLSDSPTTNELATVLKTVVMDNRELREELDSVRNENERLHGELEPLREELESVRD
jgi:hypothetical protein